MLKKLIPKSDFAKNVVTLITGTALSQLIPIMITPLLTRMFTPEDFGVYGLYIAICSILAIVVTGRYEIAILVPEKDEDAINILALSVGLNLVISTILFLMIYLFKSELSILLDNSRISGWLYFIPLTTFLMGSYQSLNYWANRKSLYSQMASSRVIQTTSSSSIQLTFGSLIKLGYLGLILGQLIGQLISSLFLLNVLLKKDRDKLRQVNKNKVNYVASRYKDFPKFLIVSHGFNAASAQAPMILLNALFTASVSGLYMLTNRVLTSPITLISKAIGDVFRQQASIEYAQTKQCKEVYRQTFTKLFLLSIIPFSLLFIFSEQIFSIVFGEEWAKAGLITKILVPTFFMRFISSPLSSMFMLAEVQKLDLYWQLCLFILVLVSFATGYYFKSYLLALVLFSATYCLMFSINLYISYALASGKKYNI